MFCKSIITLALFLSAVTAQTLPTSATEAQVDYVEAQYENSGLGDDSLPNTDSLEVEVDAEALLSVVYGDLLIENGQDYTTAQVSELPQLYVTPTSDSMEDFNTSSVFTLVLADAGAVGGPDAQGIFRHFLANNVQVGAPASATNMTMPVLFDHASTVTIYAGPGPLPDSGIHRYAWLLFEQPASFVPPATPSTETGPGYWEGGLSAYVRQAGLGDVVATSFFTVTAPGTASFSAGSTMPAATSILASASASGAVNAASRSSSVASRASSSTSATSAATGLQAGAGLVFAGLAAFAML